jgi:peptide/nickel transport system substrate-binding protein
MLSKKLMVLLGALVVLSLALSACATPTPERIVETVVVEKTVEVEKIVEKTVEVEVEKIVEKTPEPAPVGPKTLVICQGQEPETLYVNGGSMLAMSHILEALRDGPIDNRTYGFQAVILEKLPSFNDGDAVLETVTVQAGDMIVDDAGDTVELAEGMMVRPSGCMAAECAVEYAGGEVEMDQIVATFKWLPGLMWSNGDSMTADDSVYAFEVGADPDTPISKYIYDRTASYEAVDDMTNVWTGLPGYIDSTYFINVWAPLPRKLWQEELGYSAADLLEAEESSRLPMGWGAFVIKEWVAGDHITVEKNPNYYRADEGMPYVDTIIYRFVPDSNSAVAQLISGECDIADQTAALDDQSELLLKLEQEGVVNPTFVTGTVWEHVDFGINSVPEYDRPDFFEDVRTRQAIAHCLDRQSVVDTVLYGRSIVIDTYIPPEHPLYADGLTQYAYDVEKGMALLEEVGWVDSDGDGVREASGVEGVPDGTLLEFKWQSTNATLRVQYMQIYQQNLADCGIKVNIENMNATEYFADGPDGPVFGRRFDMASFAWLTGVEPPCDLYRGLDTDIPSEDNGWGGQNDPGWMNDEFDAACIRAVTALPGSEDYIEGHKDAQRIFSEQLPVIPLFLRLKLAATRPEVKGFIMDPTANSEMWNIEAFDLVMD